MNPSSPEHPVGPPLEPAPAVARGWPPRRAWLALALILLATSAIRIRLLDMPLERDEGEYAYAGQLMLEGIPPYKLASNMKFPGTYLAYAAIMAVFGQTSTGIHLGLLLVNAAATLFIYRLVLEFADRPAGVAAAALYSFFSLSPQFLGTAAHATQFMVLALAPACLLLWRGVNGSSGGKLFWSGVLLGVAVLMKQHGAAFVLFAAGFLLWRRAPRTAPAVLARLLTMLAGGVALPLALTAVWLWHAGVFGAFWFWTVQYARTYAFNSAGLPVIWNDFITRTPAAVWLALGLGAPGLVMLWRRPDRGGAVFASGLLAASFLAILPGFGFRAHYFILVLPVLAMLGGVAMSSGGRALAASFGKFSARLPPLAVAGMVVWSVARDRQVYFGDTPAQAVRQIYGSNPFPESPVVGAWLDQHAAKDARIAILGSEPQIYFYAHRHSATSFIYMYALMDNEPYARKLQEQMIGKIEAARPEYLIWVQCQASWVMTPQSDQLVFEWFSPYVREHYEKVGNAEIFSPTRTEYRWDEEARARKPTAANYLTIYQRKPGE